jgi:phosphate-selective porin OprO and OprP
MKSVLLATSALSLFILASSQPVLADEEVEALRKTIKSLETRLSELERREMERSQEQAAFAPSGNSSKVSKGMEQRLAVVERKQELAAEDAKAKAEKNTIVEMGKKGFSATSADKQFSLKINGYGQLDNRTFLDGAKGDDEFLARRLRPVLTVQAFKEFSFRLMPDFAGSSTRVFDAHADYRYSDGLQFRIGKFKPPVGLERLQSAADMHFAERGHPTNLAPSRDFGFMLYGEPIPEIEYQLGVFNGNADLANTDSDDDNHKDIAARIFTLPFKNSSMLALQGLGVGVGGSHGQRGGTAVAATSLLPQYRTPGQAAFFSYAAGAFATGTHTRIYPQAYYYYNNFGILGEYAVSIEDVRLGSAIRQLEHEAWQAVGSYVLTGEDVNFKGGVKPDTNFNPSADGWGALEAVARIGATDIDDDAFPLYANIATSASRASSVGAGLNWYLNDNVKLVADYDFTSFDGGASGNVDRDNEQVIITRTQFRF